MLWPAPGRFFCWHPRLGRFFLLAPGTQVSLDPQLSTRLQSLSLKLETHDERCRDRKLARRAQQDTSGQLACPRPRPPRRHRAASRLSRRPRRPSTVPDQVREPLRLGPTTPDHHSTNGDPAIAIARPVVQYHPAAAKQGCGRGQPPSWQPDSGKPAGVTTSGGAAGPGRNGPSGRRTDHYKARPLRVTNPSGRRTDHYAGAGVAATEWRCRGGSP